MEDYKEHSGCMVSKKVVREETSLNIIN